MSTKSLLETEPKESKMTKTAVFVRDISENFTGNAELFKLSDPVTYRNALHTLYVVVSATCVYGGPETYIFPADEAGKVLEWLELEGSYKGGLDIQRALESVGFVVLGHPAQTKPKKSKNVSP